MRIGNTELRRNRERVGKGGVSSSWTKGELDGDGWR